MCFQSAPRGGFPYADLEMAGIEPASEKQPPRLLRCLVDFLISSRAPQSTGLRQDQLAEFRDHYRPPSDESYPSRVDTWIPELEGDLRSDTHYAK